MSNIFIFNTYFPRTKTLLLSYHKSILRQHAKVLATLHGRYKFKVNKPRYANIYSAARKYKRFGMNVIVITRDDRLSPTEFLNACKNGIFPSKAIALSHVISKARINVKDIKTFTDYRYLDRKGREKIITKTDNYVIINNNIKIEFIEIPTYDAVTFKISAPHQYLSRLYSQ